MAAGPEGVLRLDQPIEGRIAEVLLCLPAVMAPSLLPALRSLLSRIEPDTDVILLTEAPFLEQARGLLAECRRVPLGAGGGERDLVIAAGEGQPLPLWAQDSCLLAGDDEGPCLLLAGRIPEPLEPLFGQVAARLGRTLRRDPGLPEGGNLLSTGEAVFLGGDDWGTRLCFPGRRAVEVASREAVPTETRRPVTLAGRPWDEILHFGNESGTSQPVFHIDMFLTPAGRGADGSTRVLLGDPNLAARLLGHPPLPHAMAAVFDDIAAQLVVEDFAVVRNPLPLVYCDKLEARERYWYFASANNAVVQDCPARGRIVWLPAYGHGNWPALAVCDAANAEIWRELGYQVRMVAGCQPLAENYGGLNCLVKVLRRA